MLTHDQMISRPVEQGDAGVILKAGGSFQMFNCIGGFAASDMTDEQLKTGMKLVVLGYVLQDENLLVELFHRLQREGYLEQALPKPRLNA